MFQRPFALQSRMLDTRPTVSKSRPLCVAPRDIFPDYDRVMGLLRSEQEGRYGELDYGDTEVPQRHFEGRDMGCASNDDSNTISSQASDDDVTSFGDSSEEGEYQEKSRVEVVCDITNTGLRRSTRKTVPQPKTRRARPYISRSDQGGAGKGTYLRKRCTYVDPKDGKRCHKLNRSPQEGSRHWKSCHLYKEAKLMLSGALAVDRGTAITSQTQLDEVKPFIQCPYCQALITRSDAMRRHVRTNCKALEETS